MPNCAPTVSPNNTADPKLNTYAMNILVKSIPNTITCLNLLSGCVATAFAFKSASFYDCGLYGWQLAVIFILGAAVFDFLDGMAARLLHAYSEIGKELDSLSDLVSFGVAPAMLLLNMMQICRPLTPWHYAVFLIPVFGALRLARFNVRDAEGDNSVFHGLPIPANALFWIGYTSWIWHYGCPEEHVVAVVVLLISLTMVSDITLVSLKFKNFSLAANWRRYLVIVASVTFVALFGLAGFVWAILLYLIMSVFTPNPAAHKDDH